MSISEFQLAVVFVDWWNHGHVFTLFVCNDFLAFFKCVSWIRPSIHAKCFTVWGPEFWPTQSIVIFLKTKAKNKNGWRKKDLYSHLQLRCSEEFRGLESPSFCVVLVQISTISKDAHRQWHMTQQGCSFSRFVSYLETPQRTSCEPWNI